jgi:putative ABC transport system permease protein
MSWKPGAWRPWRRGTHEPDAELDDEMLAHLELAERDLLAQGETPENARLQARRAFGNVTLVQQAARELRAPIWDRLAQDLHHALRRLRASPAMAALAVAMLAVAIGLSSAMFTVVDALIVRPAPFERPESLVRLGLGTSAEDFNTNLPPAVIRAWRGLSSFVAVHAVVQQPATFGTGEAEQTEAGARLTPGLIDELGARPLLGRTFQPHEGRPGEDAVALISERIWRGRFGGDPAIVGQRITLSGESVLLIGVMPESFRFPFARSRAWRPMDLDHPTGRLAQPRATAYAYARLAPAIPREYVARTAADAAHAADPATARRIVVMRSIADGQLDTYTAGTVRVLGAGVGLVFLVLCVNVTNLMLARLAARQREYTLCSALGASRGRLLRQALCEQVLIGAVAGVLGLAIAAALVSAARTGLPASIVERSLNPLDLDLRAALAAALLSTLAVVIAGLLPAFIATRRTTPGPLHDLSRTASSDRRARRLATVLVVAELALAVALSAAAGVQLRSFVNLLHTDPGIDADRLVTVAVSLPADRFAGERRHEVADTVRASLRGLPGIEGATLSVGVPPAAGSLYFYDVTSDVAGARPVRLVMNSYTVAPEFFSVYGIRLVEGRAFEPGEAADAVMVSQTLARTLWPTTSAAGRTMRFSDGRLFRVVGVTREIRNSLLDPRDDEPELYEPLRASVSRMSVTVRCAAVCPPLEALQTQLRAAAPAGVVGAAKRVRDDYATTLERPRAGAIVAVTFAAIALLAVGAGLFAVLTRLALQRRREFGIRLALGATPTDLRRRVYMGSLAIAAAGVAAGAILAWGIGRVLASIQYQARTDDPIIWLVVILAVGIAAGLAAWRPAREAMRIDPLALLRDE